MVGGGKKRVQGNSSTGDRIRGTDVPECHVCPFFTRQFRHPPSKIHSYAYGSPYVIAYVRRLVCSEILLQEASNRLSENRYKSKFLFLLQVLKTECEKGKSKNGSEV